MLVLKKKIDLSELSDDWAGCYITLNSPTVKQINEYAENIGDNPNASSASVVTDFIEKLFIEGKGYDGNGIVDIKKEDIANMPVEIINTIAERLVGGVSLKEKEN